MARTEHGVTDYATGYARIKIAFPNKDICCAHCAFCYVEYANTKYERGKCRLLSGEIIPSEYVRFGILPSCPIEFVEEE